MQVVSVPEVEVVASDASCGMRTRSFILEACLD
jgi:hypothetical protein